MKLLFLRNYELIFHLFSLVMDSFMYYLIIGHPLDTPLFLNLLFIYCCYRINKYSLKKSGLSDAIEEELKKYDL